MMKKMKKGAIFCINCELKIASFVHAACTKTAGRKAGGAQKKGRRWPTLRKKKLRAHRTML